MGMRRRRRVRGSASDTRRRALEVVRDLHTAKMKEHVEEWRQREKYSKYYGRSCECGSPSVRLRQCYNFHNERGMQIWREAEALRDAGRGLHWNFYD